MIIISWLALPMFGAKSIKRYLPATILAILLCSLDLQIGKKRKWWIFYNNPNSSIKNEIPFLIGPMVLLAISSLKWGFGNFKKFMVLNGLGGLIFTFPISRILSKLKIYELVKINHFQFFLYFYYKALFLYGFQYILEKKLNVISK